MPRCARTSCRHGRGWGCCACTPWCCSASEPGCWPAGMPEHRTRNGDNERMGSTGQAPPAVNQMPGSRPGHPVAGFARQALRVPVTVRALRELAFCAIGGPLGLSVLAAVAALPALGLLAALLAGGGAQSATAHPPPFSAFGLVFLL